MKSLINNTIQNTKIKNTIRSNTSAQNFTCFFQKNDILCMIQLKSNLENLYKFIMIKYIRIILKNKLKNIIFYKKADWYKNINSVTNQPFILIYLVF